MKNHLLKVLASAMCAAALLSGCNKGDSNFDEGARFYNAQDYKSAVECFQKAVKSSPNSAKNHIYLGFSYIETGDNDSAIESFNTALSKDSSSIQAYEGLGNAYYNKGDVASALSYYKSAVGLIGNKYDENAIRVLTYYGNCLYENGEYQDALNIFNTAISKGAKQDLGQAYFLRGCTYVALNDENSAVSDYEAAIAQNKDDYALYCNMYNCFMNAGYTDRAESFLKRIIATDGADSMLKGKTYYILGNYEEAKKNLIEAVDMGKDEAGFYLAKTYEAMEDYTNAEDWYNTHIALKPNDARGYSQYASYLIGRGKYQNALSYVETGLGLNDANVMQELMYNQAICYEYIGNFTKAKELMTEYLKQYPSDKDAQREMIFLETR